QGRAVLLPQVVDARLRHAQLPHRRLQVAPDAGALLALGQVQLAHQLRQPLVGDRPLVVVVALDHLLLVRGEFRHATLRTGWRTRPFSFGTAAAPTVGSRKRRRGSRANAARRPAAASKKTAAGHRATLGGWQSRRVAIIFTRTTASLPLRWPEPPCEPSCNGSAM